MSVFLNTRQASSSRTDQNIIDSPSAHGLSSASMAEDSREREIVTTRGYRDCGPRSGLDDR
jgi:hypothetical protein